MMMNMLSAFGKDTGLNISVYPSHNLMRKMYMLINCLHF